MEWLSRALHGQEPLWRVFWVYGLLLFLVFLCTWLFLESFLFAFMELFAPYGKWVVIGGFYIPTLLWLLLVWDCSAHVGRRVWFYLARIFAGLSAVCALFLLLLILDFYPVVWLWNLVMGGDV